MADPLSVAGSIAGLVSLSEAIFRRLYHYIKEVKNAENEVQDLKNEVASLNGILHNLRLVAEDLEADSNLSFSLRTDHVNACLATLYKLDEKLQKVGIAEKGKLRNTIQKLAWPFKSVNIKEFIEDIRQHRERLNLALSADSMTALLKCLSQNEDISRVISDIDKKLRDRETIETRITLDDERNRILAYFLSVNPNENFKTSLKLRYPTTGFWLTENEFFSKWLRESGTHLWLMGIPGAGKTVLSTLVIQGCMARATAGRAVAYFYCDYGNSKSQDLVNILGSLASQIARQNEESFQLIKTYYEQLHPTRQLEQKPEVEDLVTLLQNMADTFEDVRIIVDGLDECGDAAGETANLLKSMGSGSNNLSLALMSRDESDIRKELEQPEFQCIEIAAHTKDLEHYVRSEMETRISKRRLRIKNDSLKDEIIHQLVFRANGMFRWASCQLDHLCELPNDALRRKALTQLPETLYQTYERILMRVKEPALPLVRKALLWLTYSQTPLSTGQLMEIVSLEDDDTDLNPEAYPEPEDILRVCGSLIRRNETSLELAHFTVQEFLEAIKIDDTRLSYFRFSSSDKVLLAKSCLRYLCLRSFDQPPPTLYEDLSVMDADHPFHEHAAGYLVEYLEGQWEESALLDELHVLFNPKRTYNFLCFMLQSSSSTVMKTLR